jgi:hypothetical protein
VDLVGAVGDPQDPRRSPHPCQQRVFGDAEAAVDLDRGVEHRFGDPRGDHLDRGDLGAGPVGADPVDHPGRLQHQEARLLDRHPRLGKLGSHDALLGQRRAEGDPLFGPRAGHLEGPLGHADAAHRVVDAAGAEPRLGDREALALAAEQFLGGHADAVEADLAVAVLVLEAEDRQAADDRHAGRVARHQDHRLLPVGGGTGVGLPHHHEERAARVGGTGRPPLVAVDHVLVAVADDRRGDVAGVGGGDLGLGHREAGADPTVEERRQPALLLRVGAEEVEQLHVAGVRGGAVQRLGGDVGGAAGELGEVRVVEVGEVGEVGQEEVPEVEAARLRLQLLDDRRQRVVAGAGGGALGGVDRLGRVDAALEEVFEQPGELQATRRERQVHGG